MIRNNLWGPRTCHQPRSCPEENGRALIRRLPQGEVQIAGRREWVMGKHREAVVVVQAQQWLDSLGSSSSFHKRKRGFRMLSLL